MNTRPPGEPQRKRIEGDVRRFILDRDLLSPEQSILLAVSGGPDSTALLLILARLAKNLRLKLGVAYFDHRLRGDAGEREAAFVRELAAANDLPFYTGSGDVRGLARQEHRSLEDAARHARYDFLRTTAGSNGFNAVATGHTASDQAETVLLHLIRGTGLEGLGGMTPRSAWPFPGHDLGLLRPLLGLSHDQTLAYCAAAGVTALEDETNASLEHRRNRVRHEVLPLLRELNPRIEDALLRLSESAGEDASYLQKLAKSAPQPQPGGMQALSRALLAGWPPALRRRALRLALAALAGDARELTQRHVQALERLLSDGKTSDHLDLPRGLTATLRRDTLELGFAASSICLPPEPVSLAVPGEAVFGRDIVTAGTIQPGTGTWAEVDAEAVGTSLCVRTRKRGDHFQPLGMTGQKKLQDFFTDARVPRDARDAVPLFVAPRGIVWVGGLRIAEWAKPRPGKPTLFLSYRPA